MQAFQVVLAKCLSRTKVSYNVLNPSNTALNYTTRQPLTNHPMAPPSSYCQHFRQMVGLGE